MSLQAFRDFINSNAVVDNEADKGAGSKAPHVLAKYCDLILKKGPLHITDENEMESTLNDVVSLFKYLTDKDVFMMVYSKLLSKRLIGDLSASEDAEASMIAKLKVHLFVIYYRSILNIPIGGSRFWILYEVAAYDPRYVCEQRYQQWVPDLLR